MLLDMYRLPTPVVRDNVGKHRVNDCVNDEVVVTISLEKQQQA